MDRQKVELSNKSSKKRESEVEQKIGWTNAYFFVGQKKPDRTRVDFINCFVPYTDRSPHMPNFYASKSISKNRLWWLSGLSRHVSNSSRDRC